MSVQGVNKLIDRIERILDITQVEGETTYAEILGTLEIVKQAVFEVMHEIGEESKTQKE